MSDEKTNEKRKQEICTDEEESQNRRNLINYGASTSQQTNGFNRPSSVLLKDGDKSKKTKYSKNGNDGSKILNDDQFESFLKKKYFEIMAVRLSMDIIIEIETRIGLTTKVIKEIQDEFKINIDDLKEEDNSLKILPNKALRTIDNDDDQSSNNTTQKLDSPQQTTAVFKKETITKSGKKFKILRPFKNLRPFSISDVSQDTIIKPFNFTPTEQQLPNLIELSSETPSHEHELTVTEHPVSVPEMPIQRSLTSWKRLPPAPNVFSFRYTGSTEICLNWTIDIDNETAEVVCFEIFLYHEIDSTPFRVEYWIKVDTVPAHLPITMHQCTIRRLITGESYHLTVRAVDIYNRVGPFSTPYFETL